MACGAHFFIARAIGFNLPHVLITTETMFKVSRGHEIRKAFVEPEVIPVNARQHVAPPLMRQFVSAQPDVALVGEDFSSVIFIEGCKAAHLLLDVTGGQDLCVSLISIGYARALFVEREYVRRVAEDAT